MSPKQLELLLVWAAHEDRYGVPPTMAWVGRRLGRSKVTIFERAEAMIGKGYLVRDNPHKMSCIRISAKGREAVRGHTFMDSLLDLLEVVGVMLTNDGCNDEVARERLAKVRAAHLAAKTLQASEPEVKP